MVVVLVQSEDVRADGERDGARDDDAGRFAGMGFAVVAGRAARLHSRAGLPAQIPSPRRYLECPAIGSG